MLAEGLMPLLAYYTQNNYYAGEIVQMNINMQPGSIPEEERYFGG